MKPGERAAAWVYSGVWRVVVDWFRIPEAPPRLPGDHVDAFKPAPEFLKYLKLYFWIGLVLIDVLILAPWIALMIHRPMIGLAVAPIVWAIAIVPDILVYIGLHLRYDTTWYLLTDRALRIRSGIWIIKETTFTYENVQNVTLHQGPIQRIFGISDIAIRTAGGGGSQGGKGHATTHVGVIAGIADAPTIRDRIMDRVRQSRTTGLGDERSASTIAPCHWSREHIDVLREIRGLLAGQGEERVRR